ncbi:alpha/beta fold hydrolase [Streptomyces phaeochromogenes]
MSTVKNIVLVHGGFVDGSGWQAVYRLLTRDGFNVSVVQNPAHSLEGDVAITHQVLDSQDGPSVLVGHSYGGAVITEAAAGNPNVKALVYVAAFVPDKGEQVGELLGKYPGSEIPDAVDPVPFPNQDGSTGSDLYLKADKFRSAFAGDLPVPVTNIMHAAQRPFSASSLTDVTQDAAWHTIPSWGLVATSDKAIPPALQRFEYQRAHARGTVEVRGASHSVMISHPEAVTKLIERADRGTRR